MIMIINGQRLWKCSNDEDDYGINVPKVILIKGRFLKRKAEIYNLCKKKHFSYKESII